jgi:hypothetical protein
VKPILITLLGLLMSFPAIAQSLEREVVASGGNSFSGSNASVEWTSGEATIATLSGGSNLLTQGFHRTKLSVVALDEPAITGNYGIKVFPNPVQEQLFVEIEGDWSRDSTARFEEICEIACVYPFRPTKGKPSAD